MYNAGYMEGRTLPKEQELLEFFPVECSTPPCNSLPVRPSCVVKEVLPAMRKRQRGSLFFSNNMECLRGHKRYTGSSLYSIRA